MANFSFHRNRGSPGFASKIIVSKIFRDFLGRIAFSMDARDRVDPQNNAALGRANYKHAQCFMGAYMFKIIPLWRVITQAKNDRFLFVMAKVNKLRG